MVFQLQLLTLSLQYASRPFMKLTKQLRNVEIINRTFIRTGYFLDSQSKRFNSLIGLKIDSEINEEQAFDKTNKFVVQGLFLYGILVYLLIQEVNHQIKQNIKLNSMMNDLEIQFSQSQQDLQQNRESMLQNIYELHSVIDSEIDQFRDQ